jgi:formylglycine-generating enzyme required for sulfatase activity
VTVRAAVTKSASHWKGTPRQSPSAAVPERRRSHGWLIALPIAVVLGVGLAAGGWHIWPKLVSDGGGAELAAAKNDAEPPAVTTSVAPKEPEPRPPVAAPSPPKKEEFIPPAQQTPARLVIQAPQSVRLQAGQQTTVDVKIDRENWAGSVELKWIDLPGGIQYACESDAEESRFRVTLVAARNVSAPMTVTTRLRASSKGVPNAIANVKLDIRGPEPSGINSTTEAVGPGTVRDLQKQWSTHLGRPVIETVDLGNGMKMDFVLIPPGEYWMGASESDDQAWDDEKPRHKVRVSKPFYLARTPVTKGQFTAFVTAEEYRTEAERDGEGGDGYNADENKLEGHSPQYNWRNTGWYQTDEHPVVNVTHRDATAFTNWLRGKKPGLTPRLPTEAEWEYACRAGVTTRYSTGDSPDSLEGYANVGDATLKARSMTGLAGMVFFDFSDGYPFTSPVGRFKPNALGLRDMTGNVWQWCHDGLRSYGDQTEIDPMGPTGDAADRVLRGGGWLEAPRGCRASFRSHEVQSYRRLYLGIRPALVLSAD